MASKRAKRDGKQAKTQPQVRAEDGPEVGGITLLVQTADGDSLEVAERILRTRIDDLLVRRSWDRAGSSCGKWRKYVAKT